MSNPFHKPDSVTIQNLEAAFAGESMAHIKYMWFARLCRAAGDETPPRCSKIPLRRKSCTPSAMPNCSSPETTMTPAKCLNYAIEGETYEYTEMYPRFRHEAMQEGHDAAVKEIDEQIAESKEHADLFQSVLDKAAKRFAALAKVEEKHANHYQAQKTRLRPERTDIWNIERNIMKAWQCIVCGYVYDEAKGDPDHGIAPGTRWEDVPSWECPDCGVAKGDFEMVEVVDRAEPRPSALTPSSSSAPVSPATRRPARSASSTAERRSSWSPRRRRVSTPSRSCRMHWPRARRQQRGRVPAARRHGGADLTATVRRAF